MYIYIYIYIYIEREREWGLHTASLCRFACAHIEAAEKWRGKLAKTEQQGYIHSLWITSAHANTDNRLYKTFTHPNTSTHTHARKHTRTHTHTHTHTHTYIHTHTHIHTQMLAQKARFRTLKYSHKEISSSF